MSHFTKNTILQNTFSNDTQKSLNLNVFNIDNGGHLLCFAITKDRLRKQ